MTILEKGLLPSRERADAGFVLGQLGDPRPGVSSVQPAWIDLPGGSFTMGDEENGPPHEVKVSSFKMSAHPVTNAQFAFFVEAGGYVDQQRWSKAGWQRKEQDIWQEPRYWNDARFNLPNQPVVGVSWYEAEAFCDWLTHELKVKKGRTIRLPTEAEWEYAARGTSGRRHAWGEEAPAPELANFGATGLNRTSAVGSFPKGKSPEGICDLTGNVLEWCRDWYAADYYETCKQQGVVTNPTGPESGDYRVLRGGSWISSEDNLRASFRDDYSPDAGGNDVGFRVVLSAES